MYPRRSHSISSVTKRRIKRNGLSDNNLPEDWRSPSFDTRSDSLSMNTIQEFGETSSCASNETVSEETTMDDMSVEDSIDRVGSGGKVSVGGSTQKERLTNFFFIALVVFIISFIINAGLVSFGFWKLSKLQPNEAVLSKFYITNLDQEVALFTLEASLPNRWYFRLFNLIIREGAQVRISFPDAIKNDKNKDQSLVEMKLPRLSFGRTGLEVNLKDVPIQINHSLPLQDFVTYFSLLLRRHPSAPVNVEVDLQMTVETISYWVPIKFPIRSRKKINLRDLPKSTSDLKMPHLEAIEFMEEKGSKQFGVKFLIGYPESLIPAFFSMDIPETFFDVGYSTDDQAEALTENSFVEVKVSAHTLGRHETSSYDRFLTISTMTDKDRIDAMTSLLGKIRDDEWDWSLVVGAHQRRRDSASYLQRWITSFQLELTIKDLKRLINSSTKRLQKRSVKKEEVLSVGLVAIDNRGEYPKVVTKVTCDNEFLSRFLFGIDVNRVKGTLPPVKVQSVVEKTPYDNGTTVCIIDLVHQPPRDKSKTSFIIKTEIADVTPFVRAIHRLAKAHSLDSLVEVLGEYRTFTVEVVGERILDTLIREIEMEFTFAHGGGLFFRHGSKREIPLSFGDEGVSDLPIRPVKHDFRMEVLTDESSIRSVGKVQFPAKPALQTSFVHIYWNSMDISLYPFRTELADNIELARFSVRKGSAHILLTPTNPLQMPFKGCFEYVLSIRDGGSTVKNTPSVIYAWRQIVKSYASGTSQIQLVGRMGEKKIQFPVTLPSMSVFFAEDDDQAAINEVIEHKLPRWLTDVIKTRVKIAGFRETMLHFLLELPSIGSCASIAKNEWLTALSIKIALPPVTLNGCVYPKNRRGDESISCLAQVGLLPMYLSLDVVDGKFCDIRTHLASPFNSPKKPNSKGKDSEYQFMSLDKASPEGETLINFIPLRATITNFRSLLDSIDDVIANRRRKMKVSLGVGQKADLLSKEMNLLNKVVNGIGQSFPLLLPLYSNRPRPRTRPPVDHLYTKDHLSVFVDVESESPTDMKGRIVFELPNECVTNNKKGKSELSSSNSGSLAVLLSVQWGCTLFKATFQNSWIQLRFSQGQLTFRFDNDRVLVNRSHEAVNTGTIVMEFAVHADTPNFSSATMRRVLNHMSDFFSQVKESAQSKRLLEQLPKSKLRLEVSSEPYRSKKEMIMFRRRRIPSTQIDPKYRYKQDLSLGTVLEFSARAWKRYQGSQRRSSDYKRSSKSNNNIAVAIRPRGHPSIRKYRLPCIIPRMCVENMQYTRPQDGPAVQAQVSVFNVIQPIINAAAYWFGALMDKLKLHRYPKFLAIAVRTSEMNFALCINDIDVFEICVKPIVLKRVIPLIYPELPSSQLRGQPKLMDVEHFMVDVGLGEKIGLFGNILSPYTFDLTFSPTPDPVPTVKLGRKSILPHFSHLNVAFSTERIIRASMLSSFASLVVRETAAGFVPPGPFKGNTGMELIYSCRDRMEILLKDFNLKNPISFAAIYIDQPSSFHYYYKGFEFIRVNLDKFALVPGNNFLNAHVVISRTAFGAKPEAVSTFFPEFSEFLSGLQIGSPIAVTAIIRLGDFKFEMDMSFPKRPSNTGAFNAELSGFDWKDAHVLTRFLTDNLPSGAFMVSKAAGKTIASTYGAAKSMYSGIKRGFTNQVKAVNKLYNRFVNRNKVGNQEPALHAGKNEEEDLKEDLPAVIDNEIAEADADGDKKSLFGSSNLFGLKSAANYGANVVKSISRKITGDDQTESILGGVKRRMTTLMNKVRGKKDKKVTFADDNGLPEEVDNVKIPEAYSSAAFDEDDLEEKLEEEDNINEINMNANRQAPSLFPNIFAEAASLLGQGKRKPKKGLFRSLSSLLSRKTEPENQNEEAEIAENDKNEVTSKSKRNWFMSALFRDPDQPIVPLEYSSDSDMDEADDEDPRFHSAEEEILEAESTISDETDHHDDFERVDVAEVKEEEEEEEYQSPVEEDDDLEAIDFLFEKALKSGEDITYVKDGIAYEINLRQVIEFLQSQSADSSKRIEHFLDKVNGKEGVLPNVDNSNSPQPAGSWYNWLSFWSRNKNQKESPIQPKDLKSSRLSMYNRIRRFFGHYLRWSKQRNQPNAQSEESVMLLDNINNDPPANLPNPAEPSHSVNIPQSSSSKAPVEAYFDLPHSKNIIVLNDAPISDPKNFERRSNEDGHRENSSNILINENHLSNNPRDDTVLGSDNIRVDSSRYSSASSASVDKRTAKPNSRVPKIDRKGDFTHESLSEYVKETDNRKFTRRRRRSTKSKMHVSSDEPIESINSRPIIKNQRKNNRSFEDEPELIDLSSDVEFETGHEDSNDETPSITTANKKEWDDAERNNINEIDFNPSQPYSRTKLVLGGNDMEEDDQPKDESSEDTMKPIEIDSSRRRRQANSNDMAFRNDINVSDEVPSSEEETVDVSDDVVSRRPLINNVNPFSSRDHHLQMGEFVNSLTHGRRNSFEVASGQRRNEKKSTIDIQRPNRKQPISRLWRKRLFIAASADRRENKSKALPPLDRVTYDPISEPRLPSPPLEKMLPTYSNTFSALLDVNRRVIFHMAFRNNFDFMLYFPAIILNLKVIDPIGKLHSKKTKFLQYLAGPPEGEAGLRIIFAPPGCQRFDISEGNLLDCARAHINASPAVLGARQSHQSMAEGVPAEAFLTHMSVLPLLADQFIYRDGVCMEVKPSLVTVACGPATPTPEIEPFFMEILMVIDNQAKANSPFSDPCQFSISCLPSPEVELFERFKTLSVGAFKDNVTLQSVRQWCETKMSVHYNLIVRFNMKLEGALPDDSVDHRFGWAVVFSAGRIHKIDSVSSYGFAGLRNSIAVVCNMRNGTLAIHHDGSSTPTMIKNTAAFPPGISGRKDFQVKIFCGLSNVRSKERQIVIITSLLKYPQYRYVTVFPVDLREEILAFGADRMNVGLTFTSINASKPTFSQFAISTPLPDLLKSRIYHIDDQSPRAHEKGRFLVELRDSCDRIIPKSIVGLRVMLKPVHHEDNDLADAEDSLFSPPVREPVIADVQHIPKSDVYLVHFRIHVPGRYHIYLSFNKRPKLAEGLAPKLKWHRISKQYVYVRNFW